MVKLPDNCRVNGVEYCPKFAKSADKSCAGCAAQDRLMHCLRLPDCVIGRGVSPQHIIWIRKGE